MFILVTTLIIIVSLLLILVVLAQNSKGGVGAQFGGSGATQVMGVKKTSDLLEQLTWGFAIALIALCMSSSFLIERGNQNEAGFSSPNVEKAQEKTVMPDMGGLPPIEDQTGAQGSEQESKGLEGLDQLEIEEEQ